MCPLLHTTRHDLAELHRCHPAARHPRDRRGQLVLSMSGQGATPRGSEGYVSCRRRQVDLTPPTV
jgi:hypothetical protein